MSKTTFFFGQSIFGQLISLIDPKIVSDANKACDADRCVKKFKTKDHLISKVFCVHLLNFLENQDKDWQKTFNLARQPILSEGTYF